jgi:hypothetical protein
MFFYLIKCTGWLLHVLWPVFSFPLHSALLALWAVSIRVQTAPDTIDPDRINNGAPWYITKSCGIASTSTIQKYCMQAKASFAVSVIMLYVAHPIPLHSNLTTTCRAIYAFHVLLALYSLIRPSATARAAYESKRAAKIAEKEKWAHLERSPVENEMTAEEQWQHMWELQQLPRTPGAMKSPMTPRTQAFGALDGNNQGWYAPTQASHQEQHHGLQPSGLGVQHGGYEVQNQQQYGEYPVQHRTEVPVQQSHGEYPTQQSNGKQPVQEQYAVHDLDEYVPSRTTGNAY